MTTEPNRPKNSPILDSIVNSIVKGVQSKDQPYVQSEIEALEREIKDINRLIIRVDKDDDPILHDLLRLLRGQMSRRLEVFQA